MAACVCAGFAPLAGRRLRRRDDADFEAPSGVFAAADLFPAGFGALRSPFGALPELCFRSCLRGVSAEPLSVDWMGVPGAGRVPRLRRERDDRAGCPAASCAGACFGSGLRVGLGSAFRADRCSVLRAGWGAAFCAGFCAGFRAGAADCRAANSGTGPSTGIVSPVSFWMSFR